MQKATWIVWLSPSAKKRGSRHLMISVSERTLITAHGTCVFFFFIRGVASRTYAGGRSSPRTGRFELKRKRVISSVRPAPSRSPMSHTFSAPPLPEEQTSSRAGMVQ